jgi:hypothetical protein
MSKTITAQTPDFPIPAGHALRVWHFVDADGTEECSSFDMTAYDECSILFAPAEDGQNLVNVSIVGGFTPAQSNDVLDQHGRPIVVGDGIYNVGSMVRYLRPVRAVGSGSVYLYAFRKA